MIAQGHEEIADLCAEVHGLECDLQEKRYDEKSGSLIVHSAKSLADRYPPRQPSIAIRGESLIIKTPWHRERGGDYAFGLERIDTHLKLLHWVHHLTAKIWFDRFIERELIEKVCSHFGWNLFANC